MGLRKRNIESVHSTVYESMELSQWNPIVLFMYGNKSKRKQYAKNIYACTGVQIKL
jgi:hypothetical protein